MDAKRIEQLLSVAEDAGYPHCFTITECLDEIIRLLAERVELTKQRDKFRDKVARLEGPGVLRRDASFGGPPVRENGGDDEMS